MAKEVTSEEKLWDAFTDWVTNNPHFGDDAENTIAEGRESVAYEQFAAGWDAREDLP